MVKHNLCAKSTAEALILLQKAFKPFSCAIDDMVEFDNNKSNFKKFLDILIAILYGGIIFSVVVSTFFTICFGTSSNVSAMQMLMGKASNISSSFFINFECAFVLYFNLLFAFSLPLNAHLAFKGIKDSKKLKYLWKNYKVNVRDEMMQKKLKN